MIERNEAVRLETAREIELAGHATVSIASREAPVAGVVRNRAASPPHVEPHGMPKPGLVELGADRLGLRRTFASDAAAR
jgi:hypothetical protein